MRAVSILHTEWSDGWGGQERRVLAEMIGMRERGHRLLLATRASAQLGERARAAGIEVVTLPFAGKFHPPTIRGLVRLIRERNIELVSTHSGIDSWVGGIAARLAGVKLVRTRHLDLPLKRRWYNFVHYLPHALVSCGETMRGHLVEGCGFPASEVVSIPTGIDFARFAPSRSREDVRAALGFGDETVILMVGVIRAVKRHEIALRALAQLCATHPSVRLVLAGEGPMRAAMESLAQTLGLGDAITFLGHRDDVPDLMAASDVLLLTSRSEGVPQAVTQGLGLGMPVVATAVGGVPELVIDQQTGLLVPPENVEAVVAALARLIEAPAFARQLGEAGAKHVRAHFSSAAMLDATEQLYARLLGG